MANTMEHGNYLDESPSACARFSSPLPKRPKQVPSGVDDVTFGFKSPPGKPCNDHFAYCYTSPQTRMPAFSFDSECSTNAPSPAMTSMTHESPWPSPYPGSSRHDFADVPLPETAPQLGLDFISLFDPATRETPGLRAAFSLDADSTASASLFPRFPPGGFPWEKTVAVIQEPEEGSPLVSPPNSLPCTPRKLLSKTSVEMSPSPCSPPCPKIRPSFVQPSPLNSVEQRREVETAACRRLDSNVEPSVCDAVRLLCRTPTVPLVTCSTTSKVRHEVDVPSNSPPESPPVTPRKQVNKGSVGASLVLSPHPPPVKDVPPLLKALRLDSIEHVRKALDDEVDAATFPFWGNDVEPPLCSAVRLGCCLPIVELLLTFRAAVDDVNAHGLTPLMMVQSQLHRHEEVVGKSRESFGFTTQSPIQQNRKDIEQLLLAAGAQGSADCSERKPSVGFGAQTVVPQFSYDAFHFSPMRQPRVQKFDPAEAVNELVASWLSVSEQQHSHQ